MNHKVVAVAYDLLCTFEFGCTVELFALPRPELAVPWYEFAVCAAERGPLRAAGGVELRVRHSLRLLDTADTIVIPGWRSPDETPPPALLAKVRGAFERGAYGAGRVRRCSGRARERHQGRRIDQTEHEEGEADRPNSRAAVRRPTAS